MRRDWSECRGGAGRGTSTSDRGASTAGLLALRDVEKGFPRGGEWISVLGGVSLEVRRGELVAVIGGRMEGRSTLLKIAAALQRPDKGTVLLGNADLARCKDRERSRLLGREIVWVDRDGPGLRVGVPRFVGWPLTLHGHGRREAERAACRALERVGATDCTARNWGELSNWQRVLVGLARAFVSCPRLVVIDDLLDALGSSGTERASDLLRGLMEESENGCGVLMSACDLESAMFADRVLSLRRGRLKPSATPFPPDLVLPLRSRVKSR